MIDKIIFWNLVNTQKSFERLHDRRHHYKYLAILEPFRQTSEQEKSRFFWDEECDRKIVLDTS